MRPHLNTRVAAALLLAAVLGGAGMAPVTASAADVGPDSTEQMFWQSTERLATPDAYRAYLARYPSGFFASLAAAALSKAGEPLKPTAPVPAPTSGARSMPEQGGAITNLTSPASSGAVSFSIGETFNGPTAVGVGWLGAKKKLVLPAGPWIALTAQDEIANLPSSLPAWTQTYRVTLTTVSFGRFSGGRLVSLMTFRFSAQKAPSVAWTGVDGCERAGVLKLQNSRPSKSAWRDECVGLAFDPAPVSDGSPATAELQRSLVRLGAKLSGPALVSTWSYSDRQRGFLGVARHDWPGPALGNDAQAARDWTPENQVGDRQVFASGLWKWTQAYAAYAAAGFENDYAEDGKGPLDFTVATSK